MYQEPSDLYGLIRINRPFIPSGTIVTVSAIVALPNIFIYIYIYINMHIVPHTFHLMTDLYHSSNVKPYSRHQTCST